MSVLIKGMKKPENCYKCRLHYGHGECGVSIDGNCPMIELPDHGDLVDIDAMLNDFAELRDYDFASREYVVIPAERSEE